MIDKSKPGIKQQLDNLAPKSTVFTTDSNHKDRKPFKENELSVLAFAKCFSEPLPVTLPRSGETQLSSLLRDCLMLAEGFSNLTPSTRNRSNTRPWWHHEMRTLTSVEENLPCSEGRLYAWLLRGAAPGRKAQAPRCTQQRRPGPCSQGAERGAEATGDY